MVHCNYWKQSVTNGGVGRRIVRGISLSYVPINLGLTENRETNTQLLNIDEFAKVWLHSTAHRRFIIFYRPVLDIGGNSLIIYCYIIKPTLVATYF